MRIYIESTTILDLQWKRSQTFYFSKMAYTPHKGKTRHIAWVSKRWNDLAPDDKYYIRGKRNALWFWQHFGRTITLAVFWDTDSFNWKSSFVLIYYKSEDGYPNFLLSYLLLISLYTNSTYIIWLKKIFCSILFSKFLTRDYFLFFVPSTSIADSSTVWLDTYIIIIVFCRDIHRTLRKL